MSDSRLEEPPSLCLAGVLVDDVGADGLLLLLLPHQQDALMDEHVLLLLTTTQQHNNTTTGPVSTLSADSRAGR